VDRRGWEKVVEYPTLPPWLPIFSRAREVASPPPIRLPSPPGVNGRRYDDYRDRRPESRYDDGRRDYYRDDHQRHEDRRDDRYDRYDRRGPDDVRRYEGDRFYRDRDRRGEYGGRYDRYESEGRRYGERPDGPYDGRRSERDYHDRRRPDYYPPRLDDRSPLPPPPPSAPYDPMRPTSAVGVSVGVKRPATDDDVQAQPTPLPAAPAAASQTADDDMELEGDAADTSTILHVGAGSEAVMQASPATPASVADRRWQVRQVAEGLMARSSMRAL